MRWEAASGCRGHGGLLRGLWVRREAPGPAWAPTALLGLCGGRRRSETSLPLRTPRSCGQQQGRSAWGQVQCELSPRRFSPQPEAGGWQGLVSPGPQGSQGPAAPARSRPGAGGAVSRTSIGGWTSGGWGHGPAEGRPAVCASEGWACEGALRVAPSTGGPRVCLAGLPRGGCGAVSGAQNSGLSSGRLPAEISKPPRLHSPLCLCLMKNSH